MIMNTKPAGRFSLLILLIIGSAPAEAGPLGVIDDFTTPGLGEYTFTRVLDNGIAETNVTFSDATGALTASYAGANAAEQVVFLRSDATLAVGETLLVDVAQAISTSEMDFGLAISTTATPTGVSNPIPTDTRNTFNWAGVYVRPSQNAVRSVSVIDGTLVTATGVLTADETTVSQLFIQRNTATNFTLGYIDTGAISHTSRIIDFTVANVGTAIGFYADLRAAGGMLGSLDNLRLVASPLPGDVTGEGMIDLADFDIIKMNLFNTGQTRAQGDLTGDTIVDFADFRQWKSAAGSGFASVSLFGVPEPSAVLLSSVGGCFLATLIRKPRSPGRA